MAAVAPPPPMRVEPPTRVQPPPMSVESPPTRVESPPANVESPANDESPPGDVSPPPPPPPPCNRNRCTQVSELLVYVKDKHDMTAEEVDRQQAELTKLTAELEALEKE